LSRRPGQRRAIAEEAARLMVDEDVREYIEAKRMAADNLLGMRVGFNAALPSNGEIRDAIVARARMLDAAGHRARLDDMRRVALEVMVQLEAFEPRLIGSVATGNIHRNSDIDIQLFCEGHDRLEQALRRHGHAAERMEHEVVKDGLLGRYVHYHFELHGSEVELSVYEPGELFVTRFSSVDGKPIDRVPRRRLEALLRG
jgi:predicted component of type VI protein secretion system